MGRSGLSSIGNQKKKKYPHQDQLPMMIIKTEMMMTRIYESKIGFFAESS